MRTKATLTAVAALSTAVGVGAATPASAKTLELSHYLPPVHGMHTDFMVPWTEDVRACTDGELTFNIHPGGSQLGGVAQQQEQVLRGVVDIAHGLHGIPRGRFPRTSLIEVPFMTEDAGVASRTLWDVYEEHLKPEYEGMKVLALHAHNGGLIHTADQPVQTIEDMEGLTLRTPSPAVSQMLEHLGAEPQGMPPGQVYENIDRGVIDGTVFPWDPVKSFNLNEVLNYHLEAGSYTVSFFFVMNQDVYDGLSDDQQACIDKFSGQTLVNKFGDWWDKWDAAGREEAVEQGDEIYELSDEQRQRWRRELQPVVEDYVNGINQDIPEDAWEIYGAMKESIKNKEGN